MKIGIITLPFNSNYGGILQAYAVQSVLKKMGHEVLTLNRMSKPMPLKIKIISFGKRFILKYLLLKKIVVRTWANKKEKNIISQHTQKFINKYISLTHQINSENQLKTLLKYNFDAYVVGSDQVWRPRYSPKITNHFLSFLPDNNTSKKIAFAPSFGVDHWEFSKKQTTDCTKLIRKFHAVSIRELSGIELCKKYLNTNAVHVIDPTMLIDKSEYIKLVEKDNLPNNSNKLLTYILDRNKDLDFFVQNAEQKLGLKSFSTMPKNFFKNVGKNNLKDCVFPPVSAWIKGFIDADFVITDSFHGTVFSILFNKPFIAVGNSKRGMSRFTSLLNIFNLEERFITEKDFNIRLEMNPDHLFLTNRFHLQQCY